MAMAMVELQGGVAPPSPRLPTASLLRARHGHYCRHHLTLARTRPSPFCVLVSSSRRPSAVEEKSLPPPSPPSSPSPPSASSSSSSSSSPSPSPPPFSCEELVPSAVIVAAAVRVASPPSPAEFVQRMETVKQGVFSGPSVEFLALCQEQLDVCSKVLAQSAKITVYSRTADSYGTEYLELHKVASHPKWTSERSDEILVLAGKFDSASALRSTEAALAKQAAVELPDHIALVFPMVKDLFVVGLLVAEGVIQRSEVPEKQLKVTHPIWSPGEESLEYWENHSASCDGEAEVSGSLSNVEDSIFTQEQYLEISKVARSLVLACIMDQRASLLQQATWQKGIRMNELLEQVRGPLTAIRTLGKMLQPQLKTGEISSDIVEDILVQGDRMKDAIQQLQEIFYTSKSQSEFSGKQNGILRLDNKPEGVEPSLLFEGGSDAGGDNRQQQLNSTILIKHSDYGDKEAPMPPLALAPLGYPESRSCDVSKVLVDLISSGVPLARQRGQALELRQSSQKVQLLAAIDEPDVRQLLSNLIGRALQNALPHGWVKVEALEAPGGGVLVMIEDNGSDLSFVAQARALAPLGSGLLGDGRTDEAAIPDFGMEIRIARDILKQFGGVLRMTSPYLIEAPVGIGGVRLEVWLPAPRPLSKPSH